jgi:hypothetical protein
MKFEPQVLLLVSLAATFAHAQNQNQNLPHVQHVIVVIQENRTPDNLFQQDQTLISNGAHIVSQGSCGHGSFALQPASLGTCWDTYHNHKPDWTNMWDNGKMDGACKVGVFMPHCTPPPPSCPDTNYAICPAMTYAQNAVWNQGPPVQRILDPYFQIANQYGYANYMFQTNQGPSFPAHQFLLSGTSAPIFDDGDQTQYWKWFAAENPSGPNHAGDNTGCTAPTGETVLQINPSGGESNGLNNGYPCYTHNDLATTLLDPSHITWKYYARTTGMLWTAPNASYNICQPTPTTAPGDVCTGIDWINNVASVLPNQGNYVGDHAPILKDIGDCNLSQVSWVIPDGNWSDHNASLPGDGGPSWVAAIVNAVGQSTCTDTVGGSSVPYWNDTTILITWDDWGGLYDDVLPPDCPPLQPCTGYSNGTGKQYVYGFRVPLLVVSAYAKPGYISGHASPPISCPNYYCHDFGSILNFIEYAFGQNGQGLGGTGGISPSYNYADVLVQDTAAPPNNYSLYDFFDFSQFHSFTTPITGAKYPPDCFHHPGNPGCFTNYPLDPDNDANED